MRPKVALVTSGVGTAQGGIGVVAELIVSALQKDSDVSIWRHSTYPYREFHVLVLHMHELSSAALNDPISSYTTTSILQSCIVSFHLSQKSHT